MLSKISLIILFVFYHVKLIALEDADSIFNLLDNDTLNISFIDNGLLPDDFVTSENTNTYFYNSKKFNIKEKIHIDKSSIYYQKVFNNLYYIEINTEYKNKYLPLIFSESYNNNWDILETNEKLFKDNYFQNLLINFIELTKYKVPLLNSKYSSVDNKKYFANNYSNFFLINKNKNELNKKYVIYYKKTYIYQFILVIFLLFFPFVFYLSIFIKKYE